MTKQKKYHVTVGGDGWAIGPEFDVRSITEGREGIESYGSTADWGIIANGKGKAVASYQRDGSSNRWYRTCEY